MKAPSPKPEMFAGLMGEVVELFRPYTEASSAAIGAQFLVLFGNACGRSSGVI